MRVLFDLNVVLDVLLDRQPHVTDSAAMWAQVELGHVDGYMAAHLKDFKRAGLPVMTPREGVAVARAAAKATAG